MSVNEERHPRRFTAYWGNEAQEYVRADIADVMLEALKEADRVVNCDGVNTLHEWDKKLKAVSRVMQEVIAQAEKD